ncbi:glycosyltransferase family 2 protein [Vibrio sp. FNV 38]|nr:glycosyltransferase family 2 protein [Vibrio sp. FNV 38]
MRVLSSEYVAAVVVFYHPDSAAIEHANRLAQWLTVIIVDNSEEPLQAPRQVKQIETSDNKQHQGEPLTLSKQCVYIRNGENVGIAQALNQGLQYATNAQKQWCLLLDQDSIIDRDFWLAMRSIPTENAHPIAAIVPRYFAKNLNKYGDIIQVGRWSIQRRSVECKLSEASDSLQFIPASYAITSGSLVNLQELQKIGLHDESLFIDFVDIEWGLRANSQGAQILTNISAVLTQQLGDSPIKMFGCSVVNHSPIRHYYYFRNVFLMLRKQHVPRIWKLYELAKLPIRFLLYSIFTTNRIDQCQSMLLGILHGIQNKKGKKRQ